MSTRFAVVMSFACCALGVAFAQESAEDLGRFSANPHQPNSTNKPDGPAGDAFSSTSVKNPSSRYGSPHSNQSATNPFATDAPKLYDSHGNYRGRLSANPYDPDSTSNPFGRYGSRFSPDSINNHSGAGSPHDVDSPSNPYGVGLQIVAGDTATETTQPGQTPADNPLQHQAQQPSSKTQQSSDAATTDAESTDGEDAE